VRAFGTFNWEIVDSGAGAPGNLVQSQPGFAPGLAMAITFGRRRSSKWFDLPRRRARGTQVVWRNRVRLRCCGDEFLGTYRPLRCIAGSVAMSICVLVAPRTSSHHMVLHTRLGDVSALSRAFRQVRFGRNHVGGPITVGLCGHCGEAFAVWRSRRQQVAISPNT
jgi:hypothetical protein